MMGRVHRQGIVIHVVAQELFDRTDELARLAAPTDTPAGRRPVQPPLRRHPRQMTPLPPSRDFR